MIGQSALNQVGRKTLLLEEDTYRSLVDARACTASVRSHIKQSDPTEWAGADEPVDLTLPNGIRFLISSEAIRDWMMPNLYCHVTVADALLRYAGLSLGKMDFLPHMARHRVSLDR